MTDHRERAHRIEASFPVEFCVGGEVVQGSCINISASGLLALFDEPLDLWTVGELTLQFAGGLLGIKARVARVAGREAGFSFSLGKGDDRAAIDTAIDFARAGLRSQYVSQTPFLT